MDELKALFESLDSDIFTEDTQLKMATLFEATVNEAVKAKEEELEAKSLQEMSEFKESLVESVDSYLDYFAEQYVAQNEAIVEDFTKVKLAEKVIRNFEQMCQAFNMSLSEESVSNEDEVTAIKEDLNKKVNDLIESRKEIQTLQKAGMIAEASHKLETDVQRESLYKKAKDLELDEIFESKIEALVEGILTAKVEEPAKKLEESVEEPVVEKKTTDTMSKYLNYLKK